MRTLSATLTSAQQSATATPYPQVKIYDTRAKITRLAWTRYYTGSETEGPHAACMPADGSLIRIRVDPADSTLYRQRVTSPGSGSTYTSWTSWSVTAHAVAACATGALVLVFYVSAADGKLYRFESTDSGATWGAAVDMGDITGAAGSRVAACYKSATAAIVIYNIGATIYRRRLSGGSWEAQGTGTSPPSLASVTGLAVNHSGDWNIAITGTEITTTKPGVWTCLLGDGYSAAADTWAALKELSIASSGSNITFQYPFLSLLDVFRLFFVEKYTGSVTYSRPFWTHYIATADFITNVWLEPVPMNLSSTYGLALTYLATNVWITRPDGVWTASLTADSVDVTADIIQLETDIGETHGNIVLVLRNDDGRYNTLGSGTYAAIRKGAEIKLSPGYTTGAGNEVSSSVDFWITGWNYISRGAQALFILHGSDAWSFLERWRARRQYTWALGAQNVFQLLRFIFARAGLEYSSISSSSAMTNQYPAFTIDTGTFVLTQTQTRWEWKTLPPIKGATPRMVRGTGEYLYHPVERMRETAVTETAEIPAPYEAIGETGKTAVLRLLDMVSDVIFMRSNYGYAKDPLAADSSDYTYQFEGTHTIVEGIYNEHPLPTNRIQVFGSADFSEDWDWTDLELTYDRLTQVQDINLDDTTKTAARAAAILRKATIHSITGYIIAPLNCGQEMYDVITITDSRAGLTSVKRRVLGLQHSYSSYDGSYRLRIALGAV